MKEMPKIDETEVFVGKVLNDVYKDYDMDITGFSPDSDKRYNVETSAINRAYYSLDKSERKRIDRFSDTLSQTCGTHFGPKSAWQVLAKLGMFLSASGEKL